MDALAELLAEEATSAWLPPTAGPAAAALPLSELADTADLPRESMQHVATAGRRRRWRHATDDATAALTPSPAEAHAPLEQLEQLEPVEQIQTVTVDLASAAEVSDRPARPATRPAAERRATEKLPLILPRGPRPGTNGADDVAAEAPTIELARGPRPTLARPAAPSLRVLPQERPTPAPAPTPARPTGARTPAVDPLAELLEDLDEPEAFELQPKLEAAAALDDGGESAAVTSSPRIGRRPLLAALAAGALVVSAAGLQLARASPSAPVPQLQAAPLPNVAAPAIKTIERQLAQERRAAQLAESRADRRRALERRRREARKRAADRRRAQQRHASGPVPASKPSVPARVAPAPRTSRPITRQPSAPTCHTDLGPC